MRERVQHADRLRFSVGLLPHPPQCAHWGTFPRWGKDGGDRERGDFIRHFASPIHLAVPEKCCRLTLSFAFFDRCGKGALALSAPGGARTPFPRARGRLLSGGPSPSLRDTSPRRGERQAVRNRDSPCAGKAFVGRSLSVALRHLSPGTPLRGWGEASISPLFVVNPYKSATTTSSGGLQIAL